MTASLSEPPLGSEGEPLAARIGAALNGDDRAVLRDGHRTLSLRDLADYSFIAAPPETFRGRNVLIRTRSPLAAAAALASLDGLAARLVLCPPDLEASQLPVIAAAAGIDSVVGDLADDGGIPGVLHHPIHTDRQDIRPALAPPPVATEWVLFTSGTSGAPKLVSHSLDALTGAIPIQAPQDPRPIWATFYDVRRYGGLQMLLRALLGGFDLLLSDGVEPIGAFLARLRHQGATHVAGTPSHWRRALMSPELAGLHPQYVRLSGEIADQPVLDSLRARFPKARMGHAYASTEAGVGFEVTDGVAGFPAALVERQDGLVQLRVIDGALHMRSPRAALCYLGAGADRLSDADGWVDTGDLVERRGDRFHFLGRRSGVINVGGLKISPEEVEAVINACPAVQMSRVSGRTSPILGALVNAEIMLKPGADPGVAREQILAHCRATLAPYKTPVSLRFVEALAVGAAGKLERRVA